MEWDIQNIFSIPPITGITINMVFLSPAFRQIMYLAIMVLFPASTLMFLAKKLSFTLALKKAIIITFLASGTLYAVHADIGWTRWLIDDTRKFSGLDTDAKLSKMEGGLYDFSRSAEKVLGKDYVLYSSDSYIALRTEYFLLPLRKRDQAGDIVVLADNASRYNQATHTFTRENLVVNNVEPILVFANNAYILRKR
jgi:hypothetical protein